MKITAVRTAATEGHGMHLWVRVETDAGIAGLGECVHGGVQAIAIIHDLAPRLIGRDPFAIDAIFEETRRSLVFEAVDIIMPDIAKCGGLSECRKIANLAEIYYMPFAPHNVASPIGTMASAHVCATVPNFLVLEFHWLTRDYWTTITTDKDDIIKDGRITLSDRPGIGLELDEAVARAHQCPGTTWFA